MTASALLVVLGAALLMHNAGMSMALGAFLAGLMLAESNFRHELEADIEPFRGLLLALFFMGVGMGIDLAVVRDNILLIVAAALVVTLLKAFVINLLIRPTCLRHNRRAAHGLRAHRGRRIRLRAAARRRGARASVAEGSLDRLGHRGHHHAARPAGGKRHRGAHSRPHARKPSPTPTISPMHPAAC